MERSPSPCLGVRDEGPVRHWVLDRPAALNALNGEVFSALAFEIDRLEAEPARAIVISGAGDRAFCAGADLDELADRDADEAAAILGAGQGVFRALERLPVPTIAAVDGYALGGGFELALSCTLVVASERARFGLPEAGLGLIPGYGGTQRLPRAIPPGPAKRLMLTGERLGAGEAYRLGLLAEPPTPAGEATAAATTLATAIAERSATAIATILALTDPHGEVGLSRETDRAAFAVAGADGREGVAAFREKRKPQFPSHGPAQAS